MAAGLALPGLLPLRGAALPGPVQAVIDDRCADCHDDEERKAGLDLTSLAYRPDDPLNFATWVKVFDRVKAGEMPPKKEPRLDPAEWSAFTRTLSASLIATEEDRTTRQGRATQRRLNRYEYENALRDLLHAPWLQVRDSLPEDGEAFRFNKVGDALDVSHVQMARYLNAADYALRQVMPTQVQRPVTRIVRYYAREQRSFTGPMKYTIFNTSPERATFPVRGFQPQPDVRAGKAPMTVGAADPDLRDQEGVGVVASTYEPIEIKFDRFKAPLAGHYRLRFNAYSVWVGPGKEPSGPGKTPRWWIPDLDDVSTGRRSEPMHGLFRDAAAPPARTGPFRRHAGTECAGARCLALGGRNHPAGCGAAVSFAAGRGALSKSACREGRLPWRGLPLAGGGGPVVR